MGFLAGVIRTWTPIDIEMRAVEAMSRTIRQGLVGTLTALLSDQRRQSEPQSLTTRVSPFASRQETPGELSRRTGMRQAASQFAGHE